ncbi:hypothetical protein [Ruminococcus flavefaciens]|uniref:hypothetical protein n=1 Tax=Ruminococcus flavefaciens TaxID=1265 RepID=UPI000464B52B|nr:hypothetical protein [Ruminococcus flavefaciens]
MKGKKKITAALFAACIIGNAAAYGSDNVFPHSINSFCGRLLIRESSGEASAGSSMMQGYLK